MSYEPPGAAPPPPPPGWQQQPVGAPYPASAYPTTGYGYATLQQQVKPLKGLATAVTVLLAITALAAIVAALAFFNRASVVDDLSGGAFRISFQDVNDADDQVRGGAAFLQIGLLATGVLWIIWQFRFAKNAEALRGKYGLGPGWAIGGWFIPFGNFVLPQLQLLQAAKASDPDLPPGHPAGSGRAPSSLPVWWVLYDIAALLFVSGQVMRPDTDANVVSVDLDQFATADRVSAFACLLYLVAAAVAIVMVQALSGRQTRAMFNAPAAPSPSPYAQSQWQPAPPQQAWQPAPPQQGWQPPPQPAPPQQGWQPPPQPAPPPPQQWPPPPQPPSP